jgi:hypothetical protein
MPQDNLRKLIKDLEGQGWKADQTSKGYMLRSPNGVDQVLVHGTPSDRKVWLNLRARLRRAGAVLP